MPSRSHSPVAKGPMCSSSWSTFQLGGRNSRKWSHNHWANSLSFNDVRSTIRSIKSFEDDGDGEAFSLSSRVSIFWGSAIRLISFVHSSRVKTRLTVEQVVEKGWGKGCLPFTSMSCWCGDKSAAREDKPSPSLSLQRKICELPFFQGSPWTQMTIEGHKVVSKKVIEYRYCFILSPQNPFMRIELPKKTTPIAWVSLIGGAAFSVMNSS